MTNPLASYCIILRSIHAFKALSIGGVLYAGGLKWGAP